MVYSYAELKGRIRVGQEVRAVPGKSNGCGQLRADGSNTQKITRVEEDSFDINDCWHDYNGYSFLEVINETLTLENLHEGDKVVDEDDDSDKRVVLHVFKPGLYVMSEDEDGEVAGEIYTAKELAKDGYVPVHPQEETVELTVKQAAEKMGIDPAKLKIVEG